ncbi:smoothelin, like [Hippocampus zosterae]|uniref:smoothelin, like n=1 Tax=Hippocampus zosterae TaxID=109293 RepID=UPI00223D8BD2|nr:smoothelin, like [Hippocampus zosterae]XP_051934908.1 smoothelin, like [Hippocampus zosterae]
MGDLCHPRASSPDGETVCEALARHESTMREAIREIHVDVSAFKLGVEHRLEDAVSMSGTLGRAMTQLQQENRELRIQLQALSRQVELLGGMSGQYGKHHCSENQEGTYGKAESPSQSVIKPCTAGSQTQTCNGHSGHIDTATTNATLSSSLSSSSPPVASRVSTIVTGPLSSSSPSTGRFSSRATFAVSSKTNSIEREEPIEVDQAPTHACLENGHTASTEHPLLVHGKMSPSRDFPHEHTAPVAMRMAHFPITATTKTAELKTCPESPRSPTSFSFPPVSGAFSPCQSTANTIQPQSSAESPVQQVSCVKTWNATPIRAVGTSRLQEKTVSPSAKTVTYADVPQHDRDDNEESKEQSFGHGGERRRELVRSQTLPRNIGAQARRSVLERLDTDLSNSHPKLMESKPKLKRSQSFGVSSASSIKQILLEWCRSKTVGYQNIEIQNFSSSWSDGMAFCALVHSFFPTEFDYESLSPANRKHNFELAFGTAEMKAGCDRLIEVDDMMIMGRKPDPMCVFTYVQSLYNHLRKFE